MSIPLAAAQELFEICNLEEDQFKIATLNYIIFGMYFAGIIQTEKQEILGRNYRTLFNAKGLTVELLATCYYLQFSSLRIIYLTITQMQHCFRNSYAF